MADDEAQADRIDDERAAAVGATIEAGAASPD